MFKTGVVIGKFYPPHRGHKYLIETAAAQVEQLTVMVCDTPGQIIPATLRAAWLREIHPEVDVIVVDDRYDAQDSRVWAENTIRWLGGPPAAVFTSEDYGDRYAALMGATHVLVDKARAHVPCSGTAVRADPLAAWDCLEPCVRAYYARRVCLVGAESTGKTTLAADLAAHYHTVWVPEYARDYCAAKFGDAPDEPWRSEEFAHIAAEQSRREDQAARTANRLLICDTNALATAIWHERYLGRPSLAVEAIASARRYDLHILTELDVPWVNDGTRDGEHVREWMHERFRDELVRWGLPFVLVRGSPEERLAASIEQIDALVAPAATSPAVF